MSAPHHPISHQPAEYLRVNPATNDAEFGAAPCFHFHRRPPFITNTRATPLQPFWSYHNAITNLPLPSQREPRSYSSTHSLYRRFAVVFYPFWRLVHWFNFNIMPLSRHALTHHRPSLPWSMAILALSPYNKHIKYYRNRRVSLGVNLYVFASLFGWVCSNKMMFILSISHVLTIALLIAILMYCRPSFCDPTNMSNTTEYTRDFRR